MMFCQENTGESIDAVGIIRNEKQRAPKAIRGFCCIACLEQCQPVKMPELAQMLQLRRDGHIDLQCFRNPARAVFGECVLKRLDRS